MLLNAQRLKIGGGILAVVGVKLFSLVLLAIGILLFFELLFQLFALTIRYVLKKMHVFNRSLGNSKELVRTPKIR